MLISLVVLLFSLLPVLQLATVKRNKAATVIINKNENVL
jgi:hypothetical protein